MVIVRFYNSQGGASPRHYITPSSLQSAASAAEASSWNDANCCNLHDDVVCCGRSQ